MLSDVTGVIIYSRLSRYVTPILLTTRKPSFCSESQNNHLEIQRTQPRMSNNQDNNSELGGSSSKGCGRNYCLEEEEYFMAVACLTAQRSHDPVTQVGACIVDKNRNIVGVGYNDMPRGCDILPWEKKTMDKLDSKKWYVCHAEVNAILNKNCSDLKGCVIYTSLYPCNSCAKIIIQSGISEVIYASNKLADKMETKAAKILFDTAQMECRFFDRKKEIIVRPKCEDQGQLISKKRKVEDN